MLDDIFSAFAQSYASQKSSAFSHSSIYALFKDAELSEEELELLIGASFRMSSSDMLFALDVSYNLGGFIYKNKNISKFESVTNAMHRSHIVTFGQYFEKVVVPWQQESNPDLTREDLIEQLGLKNIESYLRHSDKISLVTNADGLGNIGSDHPSLFLSLQYCWLMCVCIFAGQAFAQASVKTDIIKFLVNG